MNSVRGNRALSGRGGRALLVVGVMGGVGVRSLQWRYLWWRVSV